MGGIHDTWIWPAFLRVRRTAARKVPEIGRVSIRFCPMADRHHLQSPRVYAHSLHYPDKICFARAAATDLTPEHIYGITAHEFGHLIADAEGWDAHVTIPETPGETPQEVQEEADQAALIRLGLPVYYDYRRVQYIPALVLDAVSGEGSCRNLIPN